MKKYTPYILTAWIAVGLTFLNPEKVFPQETQKENKIETTESVTTITDGNSTYVNGITGGRARSLVGGVLGLISIVIGWRSKARSAKMGAKMALALGLIAIVLSIVHLGTSAVAVFGSGSGKAGAIVAFSLGMIGAILGGLALHPRSDKIV